MYKYRGVGRLFDANRHNILGYRLRDLDTGFDIDIYIDELLTIARRGLICNIAVANNRICGRGEGEDLRKLPRIYVSMRNIPLKSMGMPSNKVEYNKMSMSYGDKLSKLVEISLEGIKQTRNVYGSVLEYLTNIDRDNKFRVCILHGIRRTGKTTIIHQSIKYLLESGVDNSLAAYILVNTEIDIEDFKDYILRVVGEIPLKYIFIDEITNVRGLSGDSQWISDLIVSRGTRVVITGTDSLALQFTANQGLNTRYIDIEMEPLSYSEHVRLIDDVDVLEYARVGGIFTNELSKYNVAKQFIYGAISANIVRSIERNNDRALESWLEKVPSVVSKIINENMKLVTIRAIRRAFNLGLGRAIKSVGNEVRLKVDSRERIINAINKAIPVDDTTGISNTELNIVYNYMRNMGLIKRLYDFKEVNAMDIITMPGLVYVYGRHIVANLMVRDLISSDIITDKLAIEIKNKILEQLKGDIIEGIILVANHKKFVSESDFNNRVCFYRDKDTAEIDMLTILSGDCHMYEVKRGSKIVPNQRRWLIDSVVNKDVGLRANIVSRNVLYNGVSSIVKIGSADKNIKEDDEKRFKNVILDNKEEVRHSLYEDDMVIRYINISDYLREFD